MSYCLPEEQEPYQQSENMGRFLYAPHFPPDDADAPGSTCPVLTLCRMYETRCHVQSRTRHISETYTVDSSSPRCRGADGIVFASFMITASVALCIRLKLPEKGPSHVHRYPDDPRRYRLFG